jgi:hypothetical protein
MHKLRVGNDAGRITTDERGQNVWQWSESADGHDNTQMLIKRLDNDDLEIVAPPVADKTGAAGNPEIIHTRDQGDTAGDHVHPDPNLALAEGEHQGANKNLADGGVTNKYGKKVNDDGGFNPYS